MKILKILFLIIFIPISFFGCKKEISIDDITADNYKELFKSTANYSLNDYETGFSYVGSFFRNGTLFQRR
ncbi:hypothetical protein GCM10027291_20510 [Telluribacter humicola]